MKFLFLSLITVLNAFSAVLFEPEKHDTELGQFHVSGYYNSQQGKAPFLAPFQTIIPSIYMQSENPSAFWAPSVIVDIFQILNFNEIPEFRDFEYLGGARTSLTKLNALMYKNLEGYQNNWEVLFQELMSKAQVVFETQPNKQALRKLLVGKDLLERALHIELKAHSEDKMVLWRFTLNFDEDLKTTHHTSFGLSLLGGYMLDGYRYDWSGGFSNLSACTYAYCANSIEAKAAGQETTSHTLYYVTVDQVYLNANLSFTGRIDHHPETIHPVLGTCPALAQVAWGRGEHFHPRLNPATFAEDMIHKVAF